MSSRSSIASVRAAKQWFDLKKYRATSAFTSLEWAEQLKKRLDIREASLRGDNNYLDQAVPLLTGNPLAPHFIGSEYLTGDNGLVDKRVVRELNVGDLSQLQLFVAREQGRLTSLPSATLCDLVLRSFALGQAPAPVEAHLVVRLDATNKEILEGVREWLNFRREQSPAETIRKWKLEFERLAETQECAAEAADCAFPQEASAMRKLANTYRSASDAVSDNSHGIELLQNLLANFIKWRRKKILQAFDLKAWAAWSGNSLTDEKLVELLEDDGGTVHLRSVQQELDRVLSMKVVMQLLYIAMQPTK